MDVPWKIIKALGRTSEIEIVKTDHEGAVLERQICEVLPDGDLNCVVKDDKYPEVIGRRICSEVGVEFPRKGGGLPLRVAITPDQEYAICDEETAEYPRYIAVRDLEEGPQSDHQFWIAGRSGRYLGSSR